MAQKTYYILKIKGKAKIPDYIQLRDEDFTLVGYFRPGRDERMLKTLGDEDSVSRLTDAMETLPYGKIEKIEL